MDCGFFNLTNRDVTHEAWVALNFDSIPTEAVMRLVGDNYEDLEHLNPGEECENCGGKGTVEVEQHDYDETWTEDEECPACDGRGYMDTELCGWPVAWGTMFQAVDHDVLVEALIESGFEVYRPCGDMPFDRTILFGVDGAGYGFYEAHWIPLRARLIKKLNDTGVVNDTIYKSCMQSFAEECEAREANGREAFQRRLGL